MIDKNEIISVTNRDSGSVGYTIEDLGIRRVYQAGETKDVTMEELRKLSYQPGGLTLLKDFLIVNSKEAIAELIPGGEVEPEYFYSQEDVKNLLLNGTLDQFKDCLDFAPDGVIDMIKDLAVDLEVNDIAKREAIFKSTGFNVTKAIEIKHESEVEVEEKPTTRRAAPVSQSSAEPAGKTRKAEVPEYKIVTPKK